MQPRPDHSTNHAGTVAEVAMKVIIEIEPGKLIEQRDYYALSVILSSKNDDWFICGSDVVKALGYWLDQTMDGLYEDDRPAFIEMIDRIHRNCHKDL